MICGQNSSINAFATPSVLWTSTEIQNAGETIEDRRLNTHGKNRSLSSESWTWLFHSSMLILIFIFSLPINASFS